MSDLPWLLAGYGLTLGAIGGYAVGLRRRLRRERDR
jgi:hypothetical protein